MYRKPLPDQEANIRTDKTKFNSVLTNLLKNAIKYTEKGSVEFGYKKNKDIDLCYVLRVTCYGLRVAGYGLSTFFASWRIWWIKSVEDEQ